MLDQETLQLVRNQLDAERVRREHSFESEIERIQGEMALRGLPNSGSLVQAIADCCAKHVESGAEMLSDAISSMLKEKQRARPSNDLVAQLSRQIDDLFRTYCSALVELRFEKIAGSAGLAGLAANAADPTRFHWRVIEARQRIQSKIERFLHSLPSIPQSTVGFWLWASKQAWKELRVELLTPLKIGFSLGLTLLSLAVQYRFGVRDWHLTVLSVASLLIAFAVVNLVALAARTLSIPARLIAGTLQIR